MSFQKNITPFIKRIYSKLLTSFSFLTLGMHVHMFVGECMGGWVHVHFHSVCMDVEARGQPPVSYSDLLSTPLTQALSLA